ncbi:MAG TPA: HD domain-containing protein [Acidimicrobiales bacterium]|nr:HD domain-containing protein [Acidimicrobiales bacterium]
MSGLLGEVPAGGARLGPSPGDGAHPGEAVAGGAVWPGVGAVRPRRRWRGRGSGSTACQRAGPGPYSGGVSLTGWTEGRARELLAPLGARWSHTRGVAGQARRLGTALRLAEADVLVAAGYLHDIGYAPELVVSGFHPLDGARYLADLGERRLACLVAHHSAADEEAQVLGLDAELAQFPAEDSDLSPMLDYCDLTVGPTGQRLRPDERLAEILTRYGQGDPVAVATRRAWPRLEARLSGIEERLENGGRQPG